MMIGFLRNIFYPVQKEIDEIKLQIARNHFSGLDYSAHTSEPIHSYEYKVFSQWGDDGIIQYLLSRIAVKDRVFVEFGVEDFLESNCRFLMMHDNWSGLVIDGSPKSISRIKDRSDYWKFDLDAQCHFLTKENINRILDEGLGGRSPDLVSIDVDGNDYWLLEQITLCPAIFIVEYNAVFGAQRAITIPYKSDFSRNKAHYSNLYFGASLAAITDVAKAKGYGLVGCSSAGNNAYFVRNEVLRQSGLEEISVAEAYVNSRFRESRDRRGKLTCLSGEERLAAIRGLPVINTRSGESEIL